MSRSSASCASPMRPAALRRGMTEKLRFVALTGLSAAPLVASSAAMQGAARRSCARCRRPRARFSSRMGMRSATVPNVAKSVKSRHRCGCPNDRPAPARAWGRRPRPPGWSSGHSGSHFGSATGTPSGTRSTGSWWSVMARPRPASTTAAASTLQAMPQSTVTMKSGPNEHARVMAASGQRVALVEAQRDERRSLRAESAQTAGEHGGGRDAVEVEVAEHEDVVAAFDGGFSASATSDSPGMM